MNGKKGKVRSEKKATDGKDGVEEKKKVKEWQRWRRIESRDRGGKEGEVDLSILRQWVDGERWRKMAKNGERWRKMAEMEEN